MKKILFSILSICLIFAACKKEHKVNPVPPGMQKVTFNVGFSSTVTSFDVNKLKVNSTTPDTSLTNHIDVLYYFVYDSSGNKLHIITQSSTDASFGQYTDNLHPGSYTVVAVGTIRGVVYSGENTLDGLSLKYWPDQSLDQMDFRVDAFCKKVPLTVGTTSSTHSISLDRIVSKLVVNIDDAIPTGARYMNLTVTSGMADEYFVNSGTTNASALVQPLTVEYNLTAADEGKKNYQLTTLFLFNAPMTVYVYCASARPLPNLQVTYYGQKTITNVTGLPNKVTLLSGNLFGGVPGTGGFHLAIDSNFTPPVTIHF